MCVNQYTIISVPRIAYIFLSQLRERWQAVHRYGKGARRSIPVEAKFPIECSVPRRTRTGDRVAGHEIRNLPLAAVVADGHLLLGLRQAAVAVRVMAENNSNTV